GRRRRACDPTADARRRRRARGRVHRFLASSSRVVLAGAARNRAGVDGAHVMSCVAEPMIFRLLDGIVGWDPLDSTGLEGLADIVGGVALARITANAVDPSALIPFLPPARLARGCG